MLTFRFSSKGGKMTVCERLTSGTTGKKVRFEFTPEWDNLRKMAVFMAMDGSPHTYCTVDNVEEIVTIPASVLALPEHTLYIGICGISEAGEEVIPTIRVKGPRIDPGAFPGEDPDIDPGNPVWVNVLGDIGNLEDLNTEAKDTLVDAINELEEKNRDDVNPEDVLNIIGEYLAAHPVIGERGLSFLRLQAAYAGTVERYNFSEFVLPDGYTPREYDLVMMNDGWLGYVYKIYPETQQADVAALGESLKGPQGIQGTKGEKGDKGEKGEKGDGVLPFVVTLTKNTDGSYFADKSRLETVAAHNAGMIVYCDMPIPGAAINAPIRIPLVQNLLGYLTFETVYQTTQYRVAYFLNDAVYPNVDNVISVTATPLAKASDIPSGGSGSDSSQNVDLSGYATEEWVRQGYQPKGNYLTSVPAGYAKTSELPTKTSQLQNDSGFLTDAPVKSINGKTGEVQLGAADVGARPNTWMPTAADVGALPDSYTPPNQTAEQVGADPAGTAARTMLEHEESEESHPDIRFQLGALTIAASNFLDVENVKMSTVLGYISSAQQTIDKLYAGIGNILLLSEEFGFVSGGASTGVIASAALEYKTVRVVYDGKEYVCPVKYVDDGIDQATVIGNGSIRNPNYHPSGSVWDVAWKDTGEPFCFMALYHTLPLMLYTEDQSAHTVSMYGCPYGVITEDAVNALIDAKLGGIENGTY